MPHYPVLTELMLKAAKPPQRGTTMLWDGALKHFGVRVSQGGAKSFVILTGRGRRQTIGRFPTLSLSVARTRAKELLAEYTLGQTRPRAAAFDDVLAAFLEACEKKNRPRTVRDYTRLLTRHMDFGRKNLVSPSTHHIATRLDRDFRRLFGPATQKADALHHATLFQAAVTEKPQCHSST